LLGFDAPVVNSFDANHVSPYDLGVEAASVAMSSAVTTGALMADLLDQYRQARPWFLLGSGEMGTSSIMPQKRNPVTMLNTRQQASLTLGAAQTAVLVAHNVGPGVIEYRGDEARNAIREASRMQADMARLIGTLRFDAARALEEVNGDYATSTELADVLQREADVPFRVGHHFASELVNYGRGNRLRPAEIPFTEAAQIYARVVKEMVGEENARFPLTEARFRESLTVENMIRSSRGLGGPQPAEVARMLDAQAARIESDQAWLDGRRKAMSDAAAALDTAFNALRN
jgi:argininosuccinate lyase